jgi:ABC-type Fe3+ transport system permease subunit
MWVVNKLGMKFSPARNKTTFGIIHLGNHDKVEMFSFALNNFAIPFVAFFIIIICTIILSLKMRDTAKWRKETMTGEQLERISNRNLKVSKMVVMISTLFIVCFVPMCVILLAIAFVPELYFQGKYIQLSLVIAGISSISESVNSSMNTFMYYNMSSKYKNMFLTIFNFKNKIS